MAFRTRLSRRGMIQVMVAAPMLAGGARQSRSASQLQPIAQGHSSQTANLSNIQIELRTYKPSNWTGAGVVLHFHGKDSHANEIGDLTDLARRSGHMLVAPYFDGYRFPFWRYQTVGILDDNGSPRPRETWTGNLVVELVQQLKALEGPGMAVRLIGHSAGGQFVERFAGFHAVAAVRLIAANPASALIPSRDFLYPYGFGGLPDGIGGDDTIAAYLRQPLVLYVGAFDTPSQGTPDNRSEAKRQGDTRQQRAWLAFETGRAVAKARGWDFNWRFVSRPASHNLFQMFAGSFGYDLLFNEVVQSSAWKTNL
jgi:pimeloyl-ACP methyl ester carboxylesterase